MNVGISTDTPLGPRRLVGRPHPPPPPLCPSLLSAQISATTKRGCRPWAGSSWGPGNRGADLLLPPPPPTEMGPDRKQAQHPPPPPRMPSHPHCRPSHGDRGPSGSGLRATSMLGSGTRMVTQQVVLLSHTSEQVDPSTTLPPPPPPACAPDGRGARSRRPQGLKVEAVKGSQLDRCGYPLSGLPREPPGVHVPLQLHHRRLGQHSPVHSSAVVGDPWRPDSHQPTPAPPPPSSTERPFGCGALWAPSSTRAVAPQPVQPALVAPRAGKHTLCPGAPPSAQGKPSAVGAGPSPRGSTTCA